MESTIPTMADLFRQLGLPGDDDSIDYFVKRHRPLVANTALSDAAFWTEAQSRFLSEEVALDADSAEVVDRLDVMLRA